MFIFLIYLMFLLCNTAECSLGDRSTFYRNCMSTCHQNYCATNDKLQKFLAVQDKINYFFFWNCNDECMYNCMWKTVDYFNSHELPSPQFYGKWPFIRFLGIQEPASTFFSLLNLFSQCYMFIVFLKHVSYNVPMYWIWVFNALICIHTWCWSTIFHTRDFDFTEKLDYFCAFSMVIYSFSVAFLRVFGTNITLKLVIFITSCILYFFYHIYYLSFIKFDYGYNMKANIIIGMLNSILWGVFCYQNWNKHEGVKYCAITILLLNLAVSLEILDFVPLFWVFDSHSLWHLSTVPLPFIWYKFIITDCVYLENEKLKQKFV